jgi:hypothetical protein
MLVRSEGNARAARMSASDWSDEPVQEEREAAEQGGAQLSLAHRLRHEQPERSRRASGTILVALQGDYSISGSVARWAEQRESHPGDRRFEPSRSSENPGIIRQRWRRFLRRSSEYRHGIEPEEALIREMLCRRVRRRACVRPPRAER